MNMEFFYFAREHGEKLLEIENFLLERNVSIEDEKFRFFRLGLEFMVSSYLADLTNQVGCEIEEFSEVSWAILNAESEKEVKKIVTDCIAEYKNMNPIPPTPASRTS